SIALSLAPDHADLQSQTGVEPSELRETDGHGRLKGRARGFFPSPAYGSDRNASARRGNESRELKVQNSKPENLLLPTFLTQIPQNVFTQPRALLGIVCLISLNQTLANPKSLVTHGRLVNLQLLVFRFQSVGTPARTDPTNWQMVCL